MTPVLLGGKWSKGMQLGVFKPWRLLRWMMILTLCSSTTRGLGLSVLFQCLPRILKDGCQLFIFQHQGTDHPSLAQQSGLSTQSCQKTSTNDTNLKVGRMTFCYIKTAKWHNHIFEDLVWTWWDPSCLHKHRAAQGKGRFLL